MDEAIGLVLRLVDRRQIAKAGNRKIIESEYTLESLSLELGASFLYQGKDVQIIGELINLDEASKISGFTKIKLKELCERGILDCNLIQSELYVDSMSLDKFLKNLRLQ